jgi:serine/threonine-protein kinase
MSGNLMDETVAQTRVNRVTDSRFQVKRRLGSGGMGDVYLAEDSKLHRPVAIKCVRSDLAKDEEIRKRIERECLLHARVGAHPHIVTLFDKIEAGDEINLVMEYVDGRNLTDVLKECAGNGAPLSKKDALNIAVQCLDALARIHAQGVVHRDIKPDNILVTRDDSGEVCAKLMDFGIARLQDPDEHTATLTVAEGSGPGTPIYMAPEQIDPKTFGPVSPATDIYAVGVMLYQILSGKPPFTGTLTDIFRGHLTAAPPALNPHADDAIPEPYRDVLLYALAKNPADRFPSAKAFRDELLRISVELTKPGGPGLSPTPDTARTMVASSVDLAGLERGATLPAGATTRARGRRRGAMVVGVVLVALVAAAVAGLVYLRFSGGPAQTASEPEKPVQAAGPAPPAPSPEPAKAPPSSALVPAAVPQPPEAVAPAPVAPAPPAGTQQTPAIAPVPDQAQTTAAAPAVAAPPPSPPPQPAAPENVMDEFLKNRKTSAPEEPSKPEPAPAAAPKAEPKSAPPPAAPPKAEPKPAPAPVPAPQPAPAPTPAPATSPAQTPAPNVQPAPQPPPDWINGVTGGSTSSRKK